MDAFVRAVEWLRLLLVHVPGLAPLAAAPYLFRPLLMVLALGAVGQYTRTSTISSVSACVPAELASSSASSRAASSSCMCSSAFM